jgi:hypothetical protein
MKTTRKFLGLFCAALTCLLVPFQAAHAAVAGQVQFTNGKVQITSTAGVTKPLQKGDTVNEGDAVITALASSAQIKMKDGGFVAVRSDTRLKFDKFVFNGKQDGSELSYFSLIKGGFRAVTGLIGQTHKQNYKITTTTATIGIRGTDHETFVVPEGNALAPAGAYSKVNVGETTMTTNRGTVNVLPNQMGYSSGMNEAPKLAPINTSIFTVSAAPTKTIKENKEDKSSKQAAKDDSAGNTGNKEAKADKTDSASADKPADKQEAAPATAGTGGGSGKAAAVGAVDTTVIRTDMADTAPLAMPVSTSTTSTVPTQVATPQIAAVQHVVPITLVDTTGNTINTSTQTVTTSSGVAAAVVNCTTDPTAASCSAVTSSAPVKPTQVVTFAAYALNRVEVMIGDSFGGLNTAANPADMTYVTGGAFNVSSSGALQAVTFYPFLSGVGLMTDTFTGGIPNSFNTPSFATSGIQYGTWNGYTGYNWTYSGMLGKSGNFGAVLSDYIYAPEGYLDVTYKSGAAVIGAMSGSLFTYVMPAGNATTPKYTNGLAGTLDSATLTADFRLMQVSATLGISMPGNDKWGVSLVNQALVANPNGLLSNFTGFSGPGTTGAMTVTHGTGAATTCPTCGGDLGGAFTGQNYVGAIIGFNLWDNASGQDVSGYAGLTRTNLGSTANAFVSNGNPAPTGNFVVGDGRYIGNTPFLILSPKGNTAIASNVLSNYSMFAGQITTAITCPTCTATATTDVTNTGIYYGTWTAGTYTSSNTNTYLQGSTTPSYWISGPEAGPLYLPQALVGTANYTFDAGQVTNSNGVLGTILGTSALSLDFSKQTVGINLGVTVSNIAGTPHTWLLASIPGSEAVLQGAGIGGAYFSFGPSNQSNTGGQGLTTLSVDGSIASGGWAWLNGRLTGNGLTGAIINFNLNGGGNTLVPNDVINGVAAFVGPAQNTATPYQTVLISTYDQPATSPITGVYANNSTRVAQDAAGNLTQFDTKIISGNGSGYTVTNLSGTVTDHGTDPVSGISWGRWAGGTYNITDRLIGTGGSTMTQAGSMHWITEPVATSAVSMPISGTYTYTLAGGTNPTDELGNVGTLNSANLVANFTTQTVNAGVNTTVNGATLNATATNAPIIQNTAFYASSNEPAASTSYLNVTCTGACGTNGGTVIGKFTGSGATGVAMTYGLRNGASAISGVAAFHR